MRARLWFAIPLAFGFGVGCSSSATTDLAAADGSVDSDEDASIVDDAAPEATSDAEPTDDATTDAQSSDAPSDSASDAAAVDGGSGDAGPCDGKADGAPCDDGDACTKTDECQGGVCVGRDPLVCTALDACHVAGTCEPSTGICSNPTQPDGASCGAPTCASGSETAPRCAAGACAPTTVSCAGFTCSGGSCATACTPATNAGCDASHYCSSATTCAPRLGLGSACSYGFWCSSGNCYPAQDTKRCAKAGLTCPPCYVVDAAGTACEPASLGTDPKQDCTAPCANFCNGSGACEPKIPGTPCGFSDYVCNGTSTSCPTSCSSSSGCAPGACCMGGSCGFGDSALACGSTCANCAAQLRNTNCIAASFCGCMADADCAGTPGSCNMSTHLCQ